MRFASSTSASCSRSNPILFGSLLKFVAVCSEPREDAQGRYRFAACAAAAGYPFEFYAVHCACSIGVISHYLDQLLRKHLLSQAIVGRGLNPLWYLPATWHSIGFFGHYLDQSHQMRPLSCTLCLRLFVHKVPGILLMLQCAFLEHRGSGSRQYRLHECPFSSTMVWQLLLREARWRRRVHGRHHTGGFVLFLGLHNMHFPIRVDLRSRLAVLKCGYLGTSRAQAENSRGLRHDRSLKVPRLRTSVHPTSSTSWSSQITRRCKFQF